MKRRELLVYCAALLGSLPVLSGLSGCGDDDTPSAGSGGGGTGGTGGTGGGGTGGAGSGGTGGTGGSGGSGGGGTGGSSGSGATGGSGGTGGTSGDAGDPIDAGDASMADASGAACESGAEATDIAGNHGHTFMTIPQADINAGIAKQYHLVGPHMHDIDVTADHFTMLASGNSVTITNSDAGHKHMVTISCA